MSADRRRAGVLIARVERETASGPPSQDLVSDVCRSLDALSDSELNRILAALGHALARARGEPQRRDAA